MNASLFKCFGKIFWSNLKWSNDRVNNFLLIVLKPLSAECHVIMDQSSDIVLDTPKVKRSIYDFKLSYSRLKTLYDILFWLLIFGLS